MSKIQIRPLITIDVEGDKCAERCLMNNCSDEYENHYYDWEVDNEIVCAVHGQEINIELSDDPEYKYTAIRCQACIDAERKAEEQKGYSELMAILVKENDELNENLQLAKECIQAQITYKLSSYSLQSVVNKLEKLLAKYKETKE